MNKRGLADEIKNIVLVLLAILLILWIFGPPILRFVKSITGLSGQGTQEGQIQLQASFDKFLDSYKRCKSYGSSNCLCDEFDVTYKIRLEEISEKTRIEIYEDRPTPSKVELIENDIACLLDFNRQTGTFSKEDSNKIILDADENYPYQINKKIQLFKYDSTHTCLISGTVESKNFDEAQRLYSKCSLGTSSEAAGKSGILDMSDFTDDYKELGVQNYPMSRTQDSINIVDSLNTLVTENIGPASRTTEDINRNQNRHERRVNTFNSAYNTMDKNKDGFLADDIYLVSVRSIQLNLDDSKLKKDYLKIHYLKGSQQSAVLTDKIKNEIAKLDGKLIFGNNEVNLGEADEKYRMDFDIYIEENSKANVGPVFLACEGDYSDFPACKESEQIPSVFIDIVEVNGDGHYMIEGHTNKIAQSIFDGLKTS